MTMTKNKHSTRPVWVNLPIEVYSKLEIVASAKGMKPAQYLKTNIITVLNKIKDK